MKRQAYLADKVAARLRRSARFAESGAIDPVELAKYYDVSVDRARLDFDAVLVPTRIGYRILVDQSTSEEHQRFSVAHELGHLALDVPSIGGREAAAARAGCRSVERLGDLIAGGLLMPYGWARRYERFVPSRKFDPATVLSFSKAAKVSFAAAFVRLCGIYDWEWQAETWRRAGNRWRPVTALGYFRHTAPDIRLSSGLPFYLDQLRALHRGPGARLRTANLPFDIDGIEQVRSVPVLTTPSTATIMVCDAQLTSSWVVASTSTSASRGDLGRDAAA